MPKTHRSVDPIFAPSPLLSAELYHRSRSVVAIINEMIEQNAIRLPYANFSEAMNALAKVVVQAKDEEISFLKARIAAKEHLAKPKTLRRNRT